MSNFVVLPRSFDSYPNAILATRVTASGFSSTAFGSPMAHITYGAAGFKSTVFGTPYAKATLGGVGFKPTLFGTTVAQQFFTPRDILLRSYSDSASTVFGTPFVRLPHVAGSMGVVTNFGVATAVLNGRTVLADGFKTVQFGTPRLAAIKSAAGFNNICFGTPSAKWAQTIHGVGFVKTAFGVPTKSFQVVVPDAGVAILIRQSVVFCLTE